MSLAKVGGAFTGLGMKGTVEVDPCFNFSHRKNYAELYDNDPRDEQAKEKRKSQYSSLVNAVR
jgi:hypothetical protein